MAYKNIFTIPSNWTDESSLSQNLKDANTGFYLDVDMIREEGSDHEGFLIDLRDHDQECSDWFRLTSLGRFTEQTLNTIDEHHSMFYLWCEIDETLEQSNRLLKTAQALLKAGGLAIGVETAGMSYLKENFLEYDTTNGYDLFKAFVVIVNKGKHLTSCGMHIFGKADAQIASGCEDAMDTLNTFLLYQLEEDPTITQDQTFSVDKEAEIFHLHILKSSTYYDEESLFYNRHNIWSLEQA